MQRLSLIITLLMLSISLTAKTIVIEKPAFEIKTTGIYNITKIELAKKETRVHIRSTFIPKWWVTFSKKNFIQDVTSGEKHYPVAITGGEFDKKISMGASGDSSFILIYPALPKSVKKLNYGEDDKAIIFGISLNPKAKHEPGGQTIPGDIQNWLNAEHNKAKRKQMLNFDSPEFFSSDSARVIGYIKGYDRRAGFSTGMIYAKNEVTNEDYPIIVNIHEDGRFESSLPMHFPKHSYIRFENTSINFYVEPGQTLSIILNWEEFLNADRLRNIRYQFRGIEYGGPAAAINKELGSIEIGSYDYKDLQKAEISKTPAEFKHIIEEHWANSLQQLEQDSKEKGISLQAKAILRSEINVSYASTMFDFLSDRENLARKDTANKLLTVKATPDYYHFLRRIDLNDRKLLIAPDFWVLANRFEFTRDLMSLPDRYSRKPFHDYLFEELRLSPESDDKAYLDHVKNFTRNFRNAKAEERSSLMATGANLGAAFTKKYQKYAKAYEKKYPNKPSPDRAERTLEDWSIKDSLLGNYFGLEHNLVYDILKARSLKFMFSSHLKGQRESARNYLSSLERGIKDEWVLSQAEGFFYRTYPLSPKPVYDLPAGKGTEIFRKVIDQHKGKILFVDFWGIFCGPCVFSIKQNKLVRESYKNSKDIEFIFLTSFEESPEDRYKEFVKDQELLHTYRLPSDDFRYLRELFKFNGIPRYIVINKEGQILNDNFEMHNFEDELKKLLAQK